MVMALYGILAVLVLLAVGQLILGTMINQPWLVIAGMCTLGVAIALCVGGTTYKQKQD
jgi:uncharacterized membrane protein YccC